MKAKEFNNVINLSERRKGDDNEKSGYSYSRENRNQPKVNAEAGNKKLRLIKARNEDKKSIKKKEGKKNGGGMEKAKQGVKDVFNLAKAASDPFILRFMRPGDWPYFLAWVLALIKDLLDFVLLGSLPGIGTALTLCVSVAAYLLSKLVDTERSKAMTKAFSRGIILISGTTAELFFGINFIPWETVAVSIMYLLTLQERKNEKKEKKKNPEKEEQQEEYSEAA